MLYDYPLNCKCGKKPKLERGDFGYYRYRCKRDGLMTFFSREEEFCRESWNAMAQRGFDKIKVSI